MFVSMDAGTFELTLDRIENFEFKVNFDGTDLAPLVVDEPPPLGHSKGPNPTRLLAAAVGNCLSASLLFCVGKARLEVRSLSTRVQGFLERNEKKHLRVKEFRVNITIDVAGETPEKAARCLELFEDYCTVTASVRQGIPVHITVESPRGYVFLESPGK